VEDVDHTVWPEAKRLVFQTNVFVHRDKEHVSQVARDNEALARAQKKTKKKTKP
jgi:hypothetical protein